MAFDKNGSELITGDSVTIRAKVETTHGDEATLSIEGKPDVTFTLPSTAIEREGQTDTAKAAKGAFDSHLQSGVEPVKKGKADKKAKPARDTFNQRKPEDDAT